jgi:2-polyprenyl-3-methyl-5-hydroxy-6-metoxy-1,4-benzoquinol methylase
MPEEILICPLCGGKESTEFDQRQFRGMVVKNHLCSACGLVFQSPRMSGSEIDQFYAAEYRQLYQGEEGPSSKDIFVQKERARNLLSFLNKNGVKELTRHLDIGCSAGELIQAVESAFHDQACGVELSDAYRSYCQEKGLAVFPSLDELHEIDPHPFDLISLIHVLEHLPDPVNYLTDLRQKWLDPAGWLLIEVPNLYAHDCFEIAHLVSYSSHTLSQLLQKTGFIPIAILEQGKPRSELIPLYITVLARSIRGSEVPVETVVGENMVKQKRLLGLARRRVHERISPKRAWLPLPDD